MMDLALCVAHGDWLSTDCLASARAHEAYRHIRVRRLECRTNHLTAKVAFGHDAIGTEFMKSVDRPPAPDRRSLAAGKVREDVAIPIKSSRRDDDTYLICAKIISSRRP